MRVSSLGAHESVGASVATEVVASLEELGLVAMKHDSQDKRACLVELTTEGRTLLATLWSERTIALSSRLERLTAAELARLDAALPVLEKMARDN